MNYPSNLYVYEVPEGRGIDRVVPVRVKKGKWDGHE